MSAGELISLSSGATLCTVLVRSFKSVLRKFMFPIDLEINDKTDNGGGRFSRLNVCGVEIHLCENSKSA